MQNSNNNIVNRTLYLPTCGAVPQPPASPRAQLIILYEFKTVSYIFKDIEIDPMSTRDLL